MVRAYMDNIIVIIENNFVYMDKILLIFEHDFVYWCKRAHTLARLDNLCSTKVKF